MAVVIESRIDIFADNFTLHNIIQIQMIIYIQVYSGIHPKMKFKLFTFSILHSFTNRSGHCYCLASCFHLFPFSRVLAGCIYYITIVLLYLWH